MREYYLLVAGLYIKLIFYKTDNEILQSFLINDILRVWGRSGFLFKKSSGEISFTIKVLPFPRSISVINKKGGERYYRTHKFGRRVLETYYYLSFPLLQLIVKEVIYKLVKKDGFILHASSVLDKKKNLMVFLAPQEGGKSTSANLLTKLGGFSKFDDDNLLVRKIGTDWRFFSPPFVEKDLIPMRKSAEKARFFFIKKSDKANKLSIQKDKILPLFLKQIWVADKGIEKETFENALKFVKENEFFLLYANLKASEVKKAIYED